MPTVTSVCAYCNEVFTYQTWKSNVGKFCCQEHGFLYRKQQRDEKLIEIQKTKPPCPGCGKTVPFDEKLALSEYINKKYCDRSCSSRHKQEQFMDKLESGEEHWTTIYDEDQLDWPDDPEHEAWLASVKAKESQKKGVSR